MRKVAKINGKLGKISFNNLNISKSQRGGRNQVYGRVSVPAGMPHKLQMHRGNYSLFGEGQYRLQGHKTGGKSDRLGSHRN